MYKKRPSKLAMLTPKQESLSAQIQRWVDPSLYDDCTMAIHISQALAQVIDRISKNANPPEVFEAIEVLKLGYLTLFGDQHMTALSQLLGDEILEKVMAHENAKPIVNRIFERIGDISPGMSIPPIEVQDILEEEGFFA